MVSFGDADPCFGKNGDVKMRVVAIQTNPTVGAFEANVDEMLELVSKAPDYDLAVFPELSLSGYSPGDLVAAPGFMAGQARALDRMLAYSAQRKGVLAVGAVLAPGGEGAPKGGPGNGLLLLSGGKVVGRYSKMLLPDYDIFDEGRVFSPGDKPLVFEIAGVKVGFVICEDGWNDDERAYGGRNPVGMSLGLGAQVLVSLNASPSDMGKRVRREDVFGRLSAIRSVPLLYVNRTGGDDGVVYDGASFATSASGYVKYRMGQFASGSALFVLSGSDWSSGPASERVFEGDQFAFEQLSMGLGDYWRRCGFSGAVVGNSGGIDSALTLALCARALPEGSVASVAMPGPYTSSDSNELAAALAKNLGIRHFVRPVDGSFDFESKVMASSFGFPLKGLPAENLQARLRGLSLMAYSNATNSLLVSTGNRSELSVGYATLYGDMAGGFNAIADLYKMEVYSLAKWMNADLYCGIPEGIISREPTAELAPGQRDSDSLPPYPVLDSALAMLLEWRHISAEEASGRWSLASSLGPEGLLRVWSMVSRAEFKRRQASLFVRMRRGAFGRGRQVPVSGGFKPTGEDLWDFCEKLATTGADEAWSSGWKL